MDLTSAENEHLLPRVRGSELKSRRELEEGMMEVEQVEEVFVFIYKSCLTSTYNLSIMTDPPKITFPQPLAPWIRSAP